MNKLLTVSAFFFDSGFAPVAFFFLRSDEMTGTITLALTFLKPYQMKNKLNQFSFCFLLHRFQKGFLRPFQGRLGGLNAHIVPKRRIWRRLQNDDDLVQVYQRDSLHCDKMSSVPITLHWEYLPGIFPTATRSSLSCVASMYLRAAGTLRFSWHIPPAMIIKR